MALVLGLAGPAAAQQAQPLQVVETPFEMRFTPGMDLPRVSSAEEGWTNFTSEQSHMGAFAVSPDGAYGWARGYLSIDYAKREALKVCGRHAPDCEIYAVMALEGVRDELALVATSTVLDGVERMKTVTGPKALAVSMDGAWGLGWDGAGFEASARRALAECSKHVPTPTPPGAECRVVEPVAFRPAAPQGRLPFEQTGRTERPGAES
ncbi:hypothetical protein AVJ23_11880 [Pseudoponticoccus marisrubri]|uniref:DUF4189 domain-containing protein n=1 Tax=Pseudoponticoccus marisrubri TaxID=1685382 RepID=A0A0W7WIX8_9RHOB|nr:hypothetical protein AVJ23_11880 [Pseudoponticoccus marisrubri]